MSTLPPGRVVRFLGTVPGRSRARWMLFAACAAFVVASMGWVSARMLRSESARADAELLVRHQEAERVALWRMDTAFAPFVAAESRRAWSVDLDRRIREEENIPDGPQLGDDRVRARFTADAWGKESRVTVGVREPRTRDDTALTKALEAIGYAGFAAHIRKDAPVLQQAITAANTTLQQADDGTDGDGTSSQTYVENRADRQQRVRNAGQNAYQSVQSLQVDAGPQVAAAPRAPLAPLTLVPMWIGDRRWLAFVRENDDAVIDGFVLDWERVRHSLLAEVSDVLPRAGLLPVEESQVATDVTGRVLATAPAMLDAHVPTPEDAGLVTPARVGLAVAWLAVLASLGTAALLLRATVADADRRTRFASSVTHELRTPLTTFRLYSEMLADGMVTEPSKRQEYLDTLKSESARLASLVENVLSYARVEEGRTPRRRERTTVSDLVDRCAPTLRRRAGDSGMSLLVRVDAPDACVVANADAIAQILANLVDNACKYAGSATDRAIELTVGPAGASRVVTFRVRDHGPGLAPEDVAAAFTPFERGNRPPGDAIPGIGLGLALSRGLARDHGGDLVHEAPDDGPGAAFVLTLPTA